MTTQLGKHRVHREIAPSDPLCVVDSLTRHWPLISQLVRREVAGRYKGSFLGVVWAFVNPLLMLAVYTFVFGFVFKSRWRPASDDHIEFAVVMFAGVLVHTMIAECLQRAPGLIVGNPNFVKKVVFPIEILTWVTIGTALFHTLISMLILVVVVVLWQGTLPLTCLLIPLLLLPYALLIAGLTWLLASLGVFLRDLGQVMGLLASLLMFLAPVFYPVESVPERFRAALFLNPVTFIAEQLRGIAIWDHGLDWAGWAIYSAVAYLIAWGGLAWFQKTRKGFADVI